MSKHSLRLRITLLMGVLLVVLTTVLTMVSIVNVNHIFVAPFLEGTTYEPMQKDVEIDTSDPLAQGDISGDVSSKSEQPLQVIIAQRDYSTQSLLVLIVIIILGVAITYWVMGRALRPLTVLSRTIHDINANNLSKSIADDGAKDEVGSLRASFNEMLQRLERTFQQQKHFSASAAHELKTPLATMKTSLQVLRFDSEPSTEDYSDTLVVLEENVDRLIATVNDLLLLSTEGMTELDDEISLRWLLGDIAAELQEQINQKKLHCILPENDCLIAGNIRLLRVAFFNLFDNAIKYNKFSGTIQATLFAQEDGTVVVSIRDTGIGLSEEDVERIFEPFYRGDHGRILSISGNGLGMSIVRTIIQEHGGNIELDSTYDVGTTVTVYL